MVTDIKSSVVLWWAHFNAMLNGDDTNKCANEMSRPSRPSNATPVATPDRKEVTIAIQRLEFNRASGYDGRRAEHFKAAADELVSCLHQLLCNIWLLESMPSDWSLTRCNSKVRVRFKLRAF